jgi:PAS domain S-box-containing protein
MPDAPPSRDAADDRQSEEALRSGEQRYRLLAESLPQMVSIRDPEGHIEFCNSRWREYRGIHETGPIIHDYRDGIPPEDLAAIGPPPWENSVFGPWEAECRLRRASDGALRWHRFRVVPLQVPAGAPSKWLAIISDIHERKQAEQERERLLSQLEREHAELALQHAVIRVLAGSSSLDHAAPNLLSAFCDQLGWRAAALWSVGATDSGRPALTRVHFHQQPGLTPPNLFARSRPTPLKRGESLAGRAWAEKKPVCLGGLSASRGPSHHRAAAGLGLHHAFAFPIVLGDAVRGVVELFTGEPFQLGDRLLDIAAATGIQLGLFMQRTQALKGLRQSEEALIQVNNALERRVSARTAELHDANRELSAEIRERTRLEQEIIRISEREQRRIGQDLHDGLCQELAAIAFMTGALATRMGRTDSPETPRVNEVAQLLNHSISRCRDIARGLHPVEMDADGLMVALGELASHTNPTIPCTFQCKAPILMPESDMALNLYRIAQEAVTNALKYSRATRIIISLDREGPALRLSICDDGNGIPAPLRRTLAGGMGLHIMRYRARTMDATLRIRDCRPRGTEILCLLPRK